VNWRRILAVAKKNLQSLRHDRRTVGFLVAMPLFMIAIFGYTFGGSVENIKVYVVNLDQTPQDESVAAAIIADLQTRNTLKIVRSFGPEDAATDPVELGREKVESAEIWATIFFNETFTQDAMRVVSGETGLPAFIRVIEDGTNPNIAQAIGNEMLSAVRSVLGVSSFATPIAISPELVYGEDARFIDFFAPGVMGLAAMMVTFMLAIMSFVHERSAGTLERLLSTPVTEGEIVAGSALAFGLVGLGQSIVIILTAVLLFDIQIIGSPVLVLLVIFLFGVGNQGLAFLLSSLAKTEFQAVQFLPIILFPSLLLAGVFWPLEAVPELLRPVSSVVPLTYCVDALRSVMIRGWGAGDILFDLGILLLFAAVMLGLSAYSLRKRR
jgi:ABC-2 type transport system permease protein